MVWPPRWWLMRTPAASLIASERRLSNPPEQMKHLLDRGVARVTRSPKRRSRGSGAVPAATTPAATEERGRLSNPAPRPVQRRLLTSEVVTVASDYRAGRSLRELAETLGVHHRTIAAHLQQLGIPRRVNQRKMIAEDVSGASRRYEEGASLATLAAVFNVDPRP